MAKFQCNVISYTLKRTVDITVVVPTPTIPQSMGMGMKEGETPKHTPKAKYPVIYLLHGGGNNHATWAGYTKVEMYAEEHQIAFVCMSGENKSYITRDGSDDYYRFVNEELHDFVTGLFPVSADPADSYIAGLSMGGYGTLVHGLNNPEKYAAMGALSAGITLRNWTNAEDEAKYSPVKLAEKLAAEGKKFPKIYMATGEDDFLYKDNVEFRDKLISLGADVTWESMPGYGHEWRWWDMQIEKFIKWLPRTDVYAEAGKRQI